MKIDYDTFDYFFKRGDLDRWTSWKDQKPLIKAKHPELIDAIDRLEIAKKSVLVIYQHVMDELWKEEIS